jgi:hypothetical protein
MWKKNREMEAWMGEHLHWKWEATTKSKKSHQNKVCRQNYNVWEDVGIQASYFIVLWEVKDNKFALISLEGPNVNLT